MSQAPSDEPNVNEPEPPAKPPMRIGRILVFSVIGTVVALGGYYSTHSWSDPLSAEGSAGAGLPLNGAMGQGAGDQGLGPTAGAPPGVAGPGAGATGIPPGQGPLSVPAPLDFLRDGLSERPTEVSELVDEAKRVAVKLVEGFPDKVDALEVTGRLYFRLGDSEAAADAWSRCIDLNPEYGYAYHGLGTIAEKKSEYEEAATLFRRALTLIGNAPETQLALARALIDANKPQEAVAVLKQNVQSDPLPYRGFALMGAAERQLGHFQKAKAAYESAIKHNPTHSGAHVGLAQVCGRLGEAELAKEYMTKYQELMAEERKAAQQERREFDDLETMCIDVAGTYFEAATICFVNQHLAEAELLLVRAGVLVPSDIRSRQSLAFMYQRIGQPAEAIRVLTQLNALQPKDPRYPVEIARLLTALEQPMAAEELLRHECERLEAEDLLQVARSATQQPDHDATHFVVLSLVAEFAGDKDLASEAIDQAVELDSENAAYKERQESLKKDGESDETKPE